jgi:hypothetical protein
MIRASLARWVSDLSLVMAGLVPAIHVFLYRPKTWMPATSAGIPNLTPLIPAKAGIQSNKDRLCRPWIPACAGMSGRERGSSTTHAKPWFLVFRRSMNSRASALQKHPH